MPISGTGYVGLSNGVLIRKTTKWWPWISYRPKWICLTRRSLRLSIKRLGISGRKPLNFRATTDKHDAYRNADYVIIATPTDYDRKTNYFNTSTVEAVIRDVADRTERGDDH